MRTEKQVITFAYTKNLDIACALISMGFNPHQSLGFVRQEDGSVIFYFEPTHPDPFVKDSVHKIIKEWDTDLDKLQYTNKALHTYREFVSNRSAMLDYVKSLKPCVVAKSGHYQIVKTQNLSDEKLKELIDLI